MLYFSDLIACLSFASHSFQSWQQYSINKGIIKDFKSQHVQLYGRAIYVNNFVASGCVLYLLFLEGFGYHQRSMVLMSPYLFTYMRYMYYQKHGL